MASETELERLIVRFMGDSSQLRKDLGQMENAVKSSNLKIREQHALMRRGEQVIRSVETRQEQYNRRLMELQTLLRAGALTQEQYSRAVKQVGDGAHMSHRGLFMMSNSLHSLMMNGKGAEAALNSLRQVGHGVGYMFGSTGVKAAVGLGLVIGAIQFLNHELRDKAVEAANKGFQAYITGAKSAQEAIANIGVEELGERFKEVTEAFNPSDFLGGLGHKMFGPVFGITDEEVAIFKADEALKDYTKSIEVFKRLMDTSVGKDMRAALSGVGASGQATKVSEDIKAKEGLAGVTGKLLELEIKRKELERDANRATAGSASKQLAIKGLADLKKAEMDIALDELHDLDAELDKRERLRDVNKEDAKYEEMKSKLRKVFGNEPQVLGKLMEFINRRKVREFSEDVEDMKEKWEQAEEALSLFGSAKDIAALAKGRDIPKAKMDELLKAADLHDQKMALHSLNEEITTFNLTMAGATKSQLAFAHAGSLAEKGLARDKVLLQEGMRVTQEFLSPQEKFNQTHREMSDLLNHHTISLETYNKAMGKAAQEIEGAREAIQGSIAGSADSLSKLLTYQDTLRFGKVPKPLAPVANEPGAAANSADAKGRMDDLITNMLLLIKTLQEQNKRPVIQISPLDLHN